MVGRTLRMLMEFSLHPAGGGQRSETTKRKGLHSGSKITELDKATSSLALAFSNAPRGRELIEPNARKVDI